MCPVSIQSRNALNKKGFSPEKGQLREKEPLFATKQNNSALFRFIRLAYLLRSPLRTVAPTPTPSLSTQLPFPRPRIPLPCKGERGTGNWGVGSWSQPSPSPGPKAKKAAQHPACCPQISFQGLHLLFSQLGSSRPPPPPTPGRSDPGGRAGWRSTGLGAVPGISCVGETLPPPPGRTDRPRSGRGRRAAALGPQTLGENFYFDGEQAQVGQGPGHGVEGGGALGPGAEGPAPPPPPPRPPSRL